MFAYSFNPAYAIDAVYHDYTSLAPLNAESFGIECSADNFVYMTTFAGTSGGLLKIDKTDATQATFISEPSGADWFSVESDGSGNLFINERDNGLAWKYVESTGTFSKFAVVEEIQSVAGVTVTYPNGFNNEPDLLNLDLTGNGVGVDYIMNVNLGGHAGEVQFANNFIWVSVNYAIDFASDVNAAGLEDVSFYGLAKINPTTGSVVDMINLQSSGATDVRGIAKDGDFLWLTSQNNDKVLKFDTVGETVVENIDLTADSEPRGITVHPDYIFVALNKVVGGNSQVLRIDKSTLAESVIDTNAVNDNGGTFTVFTSGDTILWTDQSGNTGSFSASGDSKLVTDTSAETSSNHYGCQVGDKFWFAGKGSVKTGIVTIGSGTPASSDDSNDSGNKADTRPTYGVSFVTDKQYVMDGFEYGYSYLDILNKITITDNFHTDFDKVDVETGIPYTFVSKGYYTNGIWIAEFCFGVPEKGQGHNAEACVEVYVGNDGEVESIKVVQDTDVIDTLSVTAIHAMAQCNQSESAEKCDRVQISLTFLEPLKHDVMMIRGIDDTRRSTDTYLNKGFDVDGIQFTELPSTMIPSPIKYHGLFKVTQSEKYSDLWISDDGMIFSKNSFGTFIKQISNEVNVSPDKPVNVMTRNHSEFGKLVEFAKSKADSFVKNNPEYDSSLIQSTLPDSFAYDFPQIDSRTQFLIDNNLLHLRD
jgi:hypothetical protein